MRLGSLLVALLLVGLMSITACSRLPAAAPDIGVDSADPEAGGAAGADTGPQTPVPTATATREASPRLDGTPLPAATATATTAATIAPAAPTGAPPTAVATAVPPTAAILPTAAPSATPLPPSPAPATPTPTPGGERVHVVQAGENLYRIGLLYGLSWVAIAEYNGITDPNAITVGQELRIPPSPTATPETTSDRETPDGVMAGETTADNRPSAAVISPADKPPSGDEAPPVAPADEQPATEEQPSIVAQEFAPPVHAVTAGDTLYGISRRYGVDWAQIAEANGLATPNQLYPGQLLKIPPDVPGPTPEFNHRVHSGETLSELAQQYGLSAAELAAANGLAAPYTIYSGQTLVIPSDE